MGFLPSMSVLLYGCTTWTLPKYIEKRLKNYTRMIHANESKQILETAAVWPPTSHLINHPSKINKTSWGLLKLFHYGLLHLDIPELADLQRLKYINSEWTLGVVQRTCQEWWMIGTDDERDLRDSMLSAWHDDDIYVYIYTGYPRMMQIF